VLHRGSNYSFARVMHGRVMRRGIMGSCQSAATSKIVKALLVTSLTHVSSAIASTRPSPFTFRRLHKELTLLRLKVKIKVRVLAIALLKHLANSDFQSLKWQLIDIS